MKPPALAPGGNGVTFNDNYYFYLSNKPFDRLGNTLFMRAYTAATGAELFRYNVSNGAGLELVKDISVDASGTGFDYYNMITVNNTLFFSVFNSDGSNSLWASKGTCSQYAGCKKFRTTGIHE
jgi:ELWxxDGT repeat protein